MSYWQHEKPLKCPKRHKMGWLGSVYWLCSRCKMIYVQETAKMFQREARYLVFKISDAVGALSEEEYTELKNALIKVELYRDEIGKRPLDCVVVESDWPEYEPVWNMIQDRMESKITDRESP